MITHDLMVQISFAGQQFGKNAPSVLTRLRKWILKRESVKCLVLKVAIIVIAGLRLIELPRVAWMEAKRGVGTRSTKIINVPNVATCSILGILSQRSVIVKWHLIAITLIHG